MDDQKRLNNDRKRELIDAQAAIDSLNTQLRSKNSNQFNEDAEKMKNLEDYNVRNSHILYRNTNFDRTLSMNSTMPEPRPNSSEREPRKLTVY